jgi:hypothetical protein
MAQMMIPMLKGACMSFLVHVNGKVVDTNAKHRSGKHPNVLVLMHCPVDKILEHADASKLLMAQDPAGKQKLASMAIPGVRMEDPGKTVVVSFE